MNHYVYFIRQEGKGNQPIKVGFSLNPDKIIKSLLKKLFIKASY